MPKRSPKKIMPEMKKGMKPGKGMVPAFGKPKKKKARGMSDEAMLRGKMV